MDSVNKLTIYEIDGDETTADQPELIIKSPWNWKKDRVVIVVGKKEYTVLAEEVIRAVENCLNTD